MRGAIIDADSCFGRECFRKWIPGDGWGTARPYAEGTTRDEAIARLKSLIADRLAVGAELISLDVETMGHPLAPVPGWSEGDPLLDEWQGAIETYRRQVENDPDR